MLQPVGRARILSAVLGLGLVLLLAGEARAQANIGRMSRFEADTIGVTEGEINLPPIGLGLSVDTLDRDGGSTETYASLRLATAFRIWRLRAGLRFDFNIDDDWELRDRDYDEASDFLRFIDYVAFGDPGDLLHARIGTLRDATLGHGTIVNHYYSDLDYDTRKVGLAAGFNLGWLGVEYLTNDITQFNVQAGRIFLRPFNESGWSFFRQMTVGGSFAVDTLAPSSIQYDGPTPRVDSDFDLETHEDPIFIYGLDFEWPLLGGNVFQLTPYVDLNWLESRGTGEHFGAIFKFQIPFFFELYSSARAEYRITQNDYIPEYFDAFYEIERYRYPELDSLTTKRQAIGDAKSSQGYVAELRLEIPNMIEIAGAYTDMDGQINDRADLFVQFTAFDWLRFRAHVHKRNVGDLDTLLDLDDQTFVTGQILLRITSFFYLDFSFTRSYVFDESEARFKPVDVYSPGVLFVVDF